MEGIFHHWGANKRAGLACLNCRARKVKCNVQAQGQPCRNCRSDGEECVVAQSRRGRRSKNVPPIRTPKMPTIDSHEEEETAPDNTVDVSAPALSRATASVPILHTADWLPVHAVEACDSQEGDEEMMESLTLVAKDIFPDAVHGNSAKSGTTPYATRIHGLEIGSRRTESSIQPSTLSPSTSENSNVFDSMDDALPSFIKSISRHLGAEDIQYLRIKGSFQIPSVSLRNGVIRAYIQYVHPYLPLLNLAEFLDATWNCSGETGPRPQISVLLFQAVMYVGLAFVELDEIHRAGYAGRREARRLWYDKVRLLYDLDVDSDRLTNIQALLLLAYTNSIPGDAKGDWHWMGNAISLAYSIGLHRAHDNKDLKPDEVRLRRRVWWSCYIRDRMMALSICRLMRIRDDDYDTPMLTADDFDIHGSDGERMASVLGQLNIDVAQRQRLAEISAKLVQLCGMIGQVLSLHFSILHEGSSAPAFYDSYGKTVPMLYLRSQRSCQTRVATLSMLDEQLRRWYSDLPESCRMQYRHPANTQTMDTAGSHPEGSRISDFHAAVLHEIFFGLVSILHRPILSQKSTTPAHQAQRQLAHKRFLEAAFELSDIDRHLHSRKLACFLPGTIVSLQLPAATIIAAGLKTADASGVNDRLDRILQCCLIAEALRDVYIGTDLSMMFLRDLMKRVGVVPQIGWDSKLYGLGYNGQWSWLAASAAAARATSPPRDDQPTYRAGMDAAGAKEAKMMDTNTGDDVPDAHPSCGTSELMEWPRTAVGSPLAMPDTLDLNAADLEELFNIHVDFDMLEYLEV